MLPTQQQIREYAEKLLRGTITPAEKELLDEWYRNEPLADVYWPVEETETEAEQRILASVRRRMYLAPVRPAIRAQKKRLFWSLAATAAVLAAFCMLVVLYIANGRRTTPVAAVNRITPHVFDKTTNYTRHLTLPDGSTVIVKANSKLDYPDSFAGNSREVILVGEAYFDIARDTKRPFIIHTGEIKTTVLGTAFNINASTDTKKITISVTSGKVKVEQKNKLLAIVDPNQQVTFNISRAQAEKRSVDAFAVVSDWTKQEMAFDDISFEEAMQLLSRRYGVSIDFKNPALKSCTVKAYFNGTESLEKVLEVLCIISNASYSIGPDKVVELSGKGCAG